MEEQLISFENAKTLKEKGFEESCILSYFKGGNLSLSHCYSLKDDECNPKDEIYAPTQSLVTKWLREVHKIYVTSLPTYVGDDIDKKHYFEISYGKHLKQMGDKYGYFDTYEAALEVGIFEALQLIKDETTDNPTN